MHDQATGVHERLDFIWLELTGRCNLECVHCIGADAGEAYLGEVVAAIGDANIVIATDYPHRDSLFPEAIQTLVERDDLSARAKTRILWDNVARLYARAAS